MKALRCSPPGVVLDDHVPKPEILPGESLVRMRLAGICRTDLELTKGYMNFEGVLGHEFVGEIDSSPAPWPVATRVVGEINAGCGRCEYCRKGLERHCPNRKVLGIFNRDGCMAEWITLPNQNLFAVPHDITDETAVFTEPLAAALEIFEQVHIDPSHRICVLGDGKLGLLVTLVMAHRHDGEMALVGHHTDNFDAVPDSVNSMLESHVDSSQHKQWDVVIEATGSSQGLKLAMLLVRPRGTIVLKSTMAVTEPLDLTPLVIDEITVVGSRCGRFAPAIQWLARGILPLDRLVEAVYPLERATAAWERALSPGAKKVLLRIHE